MQNVYSIKEPSEFDFVACNPKALNPKPYTIDPNPKPLTLNPKPYNLNPKPQAPHRVVEAKCCGRALASFEARSPLQDVGFLGLRGLVFSEPRIIRV